MLRQFEEIYPDAAAQVFQSLDRQSQHRQKLEWAALVHGVIRSYAGLGAGVVVALTFGVFSWDLIRTGHDVAGSIVGVVDLVGLVSVFVLGRHTVGEDLKRKREEMENLKRGKGDERTALPARR